MATGAARLAVKSPSMKFPIRSENTQFIPRVSTMGINVIRSASSPIPHREAFGWSCGGGASPIGSMSEDVAGPHTPIPSTLSSTNAE